MTLRLGSITTVVASSAEAAREILQVHDQTFSGRFVPEAVAGQPDPGFTLAWAPGDHLWRNRRRVCNKELFDNQKLDELQHLRHKKAEELVSQIRNCAASGTQDLIIGGSDKTSITIEWAMTELLRNPNVLQKAQVEILDKIGSPKRVKESDIDDLLYLHAIVKETMRLHPTAPLLLPYKAENDCQILNFTILKNSQVFVNVWAIARDPDTWEKPREFIPDRFLNSNVNLKGRHFELIPFGAGRRICSRMHLAARMVNLTLASLLQSFDWKLPEGITPEHLDIGREIWGRHEEIYSSFIYSYCKINWVSSMLEKPYALR